MDFLWLNTDLTRYKITYTVSVKLGNVCSFFFKVWKFIPKQLKYCARLTELDFIFVYICAILKICVSMGFITRFRYESKKSLLNKSAQVNIFFSIT